VHALQLRVAQETFQSVIEEEWAWTRFLPSHDRDAFFRELIGTARACASVDHYEPLAQLIRAWKTTAEVRADPSLVALLNREPDDDQLEVPTP